MYHSDDMNALMLRDVSIAYDDNVVLSHVNLDIAAGEFVGIVGPNGACKSTLLNAIVGIARVVGGNISYCGTPIERVRARIAFMPQREGVDWTFPVTVSDVVLMGRQARIGWLRHATRDDRAVADWALQTVGMWEQRGKPIAQLSGGQQQRVFLARTLAQEGDVLLLDEPLTGVDATTEETILSVLQSLHQQGRTILMNTHDLTMAKELATQLLFLNRRIVAYGTVAETLTADTLRQTYGARVVLSDEANVMLLMRDDSHHAHHHHAGKPLL